MKILLCEPLVRRDCAAAQSFYVGYVVNERGKEDMKQKQKSFGKRLLSMFLTAVLLLSGITVPVQADNSQGEAAAAEEKPHVYFQYDDGRTQEMDENNTFTLTALDKGTFVLEGVEGAKPEWNFSQQVEQSEGGYQTHYWIQAYTGRYQPRDVRKVSGNVTDQNNGNQVYQSFTINQVSSNIEELKAFVDGQEVSDEKPLYVDGSTTKTATLKARVKGSNEFVDVDATVSDVEVTYGPAISMTAGKFRILGEGEIGMKICLPEDMKKLAVNFKVISGKVHVQSIDVKVPSEWKIKKWDSLDGLCYIGIMRGNNPTENFNYSIVPENASNQKLVWEALTPDIAEYVESFDRGLVPKKAGVAKFHVYSEDNPKASQDVSVEFKYEYPLKDAKAEQDSYTFEEGSSKEFKILTTPSNATEQRYNWSYSKEGIATVSDAIETATGNVNLPHKTKHYIKALKAGEVTVTGVPYDTTAGCKPVQFTIQVTKDGTVPDNTNYLDMAKEDIAHGTAYLSKQSMEKYGDEWNIFTVLRAGGSISQEKLDIYYESVANQLKKATFSRKFRYTDAARVAITLAAMGKDLTDVDGVNLMKMIYNDELKTKMSKDTSNCPIWGLIALDCQNAEIPSDAVWTREKLIDLILSYQTAEGGFGLIDNKTSSIDMTGMALQALAPYREQENVKPAFDKALKHFKENMTPEAGFTDAGKENSCTVAQVLTALTAAGIDPLNKENGFTVGNKNIIKNLHTYKGEQGFLWQTGLKPDVMATQQVTYAMEAYRRFAENENRLYDCTDVGKDAQDKEAADAVSKLIEVIGDEITLESKPAIEAARKAYNALTDVQKKLVTNYEKLTKAEEELKKLEADQKPEGKAVVSVERFTIGQGYYQEPIQVKLEEGETAASLLKKVIGTENYAGENDLLEGIKDADLGVNQVSIPSFISEKLEGPTTEEAKEIGNSDEYLDYGDYFEWSDWYFTVNNKLKDSMAVTYKVKDGDVLRFQFSLLAGIDVKGNKNVEISNKDELIKLMAKVNADKEKYMAMPAVKEAYEEAVAANVAMITPQKEIDALVKKLQKAMDGDQNESDKNAADKVIKKIEAIGDRITLEGKAAIEEARTEYDKLTDAQKKLVTNYDKLTKAEKELQKLEEQQKEDEKEAKAVVEKINAIGDKVTLDSKKAIEEARTEYDKLTDAQKKLVTNYDKLTKAEKELQKLEENQNGWKETENGWMYYQSGEKVIGWIFVDSHWYYLNNSGIMETGWVAVNGHWYYMDQWGAMCTGWVAVNGHWYYMDQWGAMCTGWVAVNGHWYYMDQWGAMCTGWVAVNGHWYYMDQWGAMCTGWVAVNGYWYYLNSDGSMASSQWIGDYYVQADGSMATSTWIGGYYVDASGKWVQSA